jgi:hypothetical protein
MRLYLLGTWHKNGQLKVFSRRRRAIRPKDVKDIAVKNLFVCLTERRKSEEEIAIVLAACLEKRDLWVWLWVCGRVARWYIYFQTKNPNLGQFWRVLQRKMLANLMAILYI